MAEANHWTPEEMMLMAETAYQLHQQGKNREALTFFRGLFTIDPRNVYCLDALAALSLALRRPEDALEYTSLLLNLAPYQAEAIARRCEANILLGRLQDVPGDLDVLKHIGAKALYRRIQMRLAAATRMPISPSHTERCGQLNPITQ